MNYERKLLNRLKRIRGQVDGLIRMVEGDCYCIDVSNQILAVISGLKSANREIINNHLKMCVADTIKSSNSEDVEKKLEEVEVLIKKLSNY